MFINYHLLKDFGITFLYFIKSMFLYYKMWLTTMINAHKIKEEFLYLMGKDGKLLVEPKNTFEDFKLIYVFFI
jgi:hypothetical protein